MTEHTTDVEAWADPAMFEAEGHEGWTFAKGVIPKVHLMWMTPDPLGAVAAMAAMYTGKVVRDLKDVTDDERQDMWEASTATALETPLEAIKLHFMIDGVDRAFTHQHVRQRTAAFSQESLRFAVIDNLVQGTSLPPSLVDTREDDPKRVIWNDTVQGIQDAYHQLVSAGMPQEDARGLLPHATATRINYVTDLRNLAAHAGNRLCTQAQFHWRHVFTEISRAIRNYQPDFSWTIDSRGVAEDWDRQFRWQFELLADSKIFRPACYQKGFCPFKASFDRPCTIRDRVDNFAKHNVPSELWVNDHGYTQGDLDVVLKGIFPAEWMLMDDAARP